MEKSSTNPIPSFDIERREVKKEQTLGQPVGTQRPGPKPNSQLPPARLVEAMTRDPENQPKDRWSADPIHRGHPNEDQRQPTTGTQIVPTGWKSTIDLRVSRAQQTRTSGLSFLRRAFVWLIGGRGDMFFFLF